MIREQWESFERQVIPIGASAIQRQEMRRAFYAGAIALFSSILSILDPGTEPTDRDLRVMDALKAEMDDWERRLKAGEV